MQGRVGGRGAVLGAAAAAAAHLAEEIAGVALLVRLSAALAVQESVQALVPLRHSAVRHRARRGGRAAWRRRHAAGAGVLVGRMCAMAATMT